MIAERFKSGRRPDRVDRRDRFKLTPYVPVPTKAVVRSVPVTGGRDQGMTSSCTGYAAAWMMQQVLLSRGIGFGPASALYPYFYARNKDGSPEGEDAGATIRGLFAALKDHGVPAERFWPDGASLRDEPGERARTYGEAVRISQYLRCDSVADIRHSIAIEDQSVVIGVVVYDELFRPVDGVVPMPDPWMTQPVGGHALVIYGYDDATQRFDVVSPGWSTWAHRGFAQLPYDWLYLDYWDGWCVDFNALPDPKTV